VVPATAEALAAAIRHAVRAGLDVLDPSDIVRHVDRYSWPRLAREYALADLYAPRSPADAVRSSTPRRNVVFRYLHALRAGRHLGWGR
jgi:hypothetical protein